MDFSKSIVFLIGVFLWYMSSIMVNVHWKNTFKSYGLTQSTTNQHYQFAMFFTTVQFAAGTVSSFILILCSGKLSNLTAIIFSWKKGVIIGSLFYLGQLSTNMSLTMNSITLTHMVKTLEPLLALLWALTILKNKISCVSIIHMNIMLAGVFLTSYNEVTFNYMGVGFALASNISLSLRNLFIKLSNKNEMINGLQIFFVSCFFGFLYSYTLSLLFGESFTNIEYDIFNADNIKMGMYFSGQHIMSYLLLFGISITTHALMNCLKRALIIFMSSVLLGINLPILQIAGIIITIIGTIFYVFEIKQPLHRTSEDKGASNVNNKLTQNFGRTFLKNYKFIIILPVALLLCLTTFGTYHETNKLLFKSRNAYATAVWGFDAPLNIKTLDFVNIYSDSSITDLKIICYNVEKCKKSVIEWNSDSLSIEIIQLKAFELSKGTTVATWMASHPINKIKSVTCFPAYFHKMMYLSALWKYGGHVIDMALHVTEDSDVKEFVISSSFEGCLLDNSKSSALICNLPSENKYTEVLINKVYNLFITNPKTCIFNSSSHEETLLTKTVASNIGYNIPPPERNFALMKYTSTHNLGDEMQSIAAAHILPHIHTFIDRATFNNPDNTHLTYIANAWWWGGILFKKIPNVIAVPIAIHIGPDTYKRVESSKTIFNAMAPIGARDEITYEKLNEMGIASLFSGCLTLWMKNPNLFTNLKRNNEIIIVDLKWKKNPIPVNGTNVKYLSHYWGLEKYGKNMHMVNYTTEQRFSSAYELLMQYAQAKVVVTSRIHVALPCVAIGTPVIYFNSKELWDSNGKTSSPRVAGLLDLFHTVDSFTMDEKSMLEYFKNFNWDNPPPNPSPSKVENFKKEAKKILERIPELAVSLKVLELI